MVNHLKEFLRLESAGGILLVIADLVARTIIAPRQVPVGAITAVIGVPLFLFLLSRTATSED